MHRFVHEGDRTVREGSMKRMRASAVNSAEADIVPRLSADRVGLKMRGTAH
jgi:hypothetical protein